MSDCVRCVCAPFYPDACGSCSKLQALYSGSQPDAILLSQACSKLCFAISSLFLHSSIFKSVCGFTQSGVVGYFRIQRLKASAFAAANFSFLRLSRSRVTGALMSRMFCSRTSGFAIHISEPIETVSAKLTAIIHFVILFPLWPCQSPRIVARPFLFYRSQSVAG